MEALTVDRLHFAFTATFHYLFPQLTMGLALLIVWLKTLGIRTGNEDYHRAARFWAKIFAINFAVGVATGIPMEFQFGTNWSRFSKSSGGVIGQTLALEGVYSFFIESSFLGLFLYGEKMLGPVGHWISAVLVWFGSWLSGFFIVVTNAWMQHPTGYTLGPAGDLRLSSFWNLILNPWGLWQYAHTMFGATATGAFAMASTGAFYLLSKRHEQYGRIFVANGVGAALLASLFLLASGDGQGRNVAAFQPVTLAASEGLFHSEHGARLAILGQPDTDTLRLDNPLVIPNVLSFLTYRHWAAEVKGLDEYSRDLWPDNVPLLYYSFHIMVGLGTLFLGITAICAIWLLRGRLFGSRPLLWILMLALPFPYIANTAGWMTAELGRQPWLVYGILRTANGSSPSVLAGNALFTLVGFMGVYLVLGMLWLFLIYREIERGPEIEHAPEIEYAPGLEHPL